MAIIAQSILTILRSSFLQTPSFLQQYRILQYKIGVIGSHGGSFLGPKRGVPPQKKSFFFYILLVNRQIGIVTMRHFDIFNCQGVSKSREVARGPKDPPPGVIGLSSYQIWFVQILYFLLSNFETFSQWKAFTK